MELLNKILFELFYFLKQDNRDIYTQHIRIDIFGKYMGNQRRH